MNFRRLWRVIYSRTFITVVSLAIAIYAIFAIVFYALNVLPFAYAVLQTFQFFVAIYILNLPMNTSFKLTWIVFVLTVPIFGALFYFILKSNVETRRYEKTFKIHTEELKEFGHTSAKVVDTLKNYNNSLSDLEYYMSHHTGYAMHANTDAKYYPSGQAFFEDLVEALKSAKDYIFMEYYIVDFGYMWDTILEILTQKAAEGVEVRFMYDGSNSLFLLPYSYYKTLRLRGIKAKVFSQIIPALSSTHNNRDHRKITVVDGRVAFTGGANLADEYINRIERFGYWKDAAVRIEGEAVLNFTYMFLQMWNADEKLHNDDRKYLHAIQAKAKATVESQAFFLPHGDSPFDHEEIGKRIYLDMIQGARDHIYIMTPYLVLDDEMIDNLCYAAKRGIDVKILLPHIYDKQMPYLVARTDFDQYLAAGIEIYEYTPGFVHSKVVLVDNMKVSVGTINMDFRSLYLNFECGLYAYNHQGLVKAVRKDFEESFAVSELITKEKFAQYPLKKRLIGATLKIFAPLF